MDSELQPSPQIEPGSVPLRNTKHERFAVARAAMFGLLESAREAGYPDMTAGNAAKIDRMPLVRDRIRYLSGDTVEVVRQLRTKVSGKLHLIRDASMGDFIRMERDPGAVALIKGMEIPENEKLSRIAALPVLPYLDLTRIAQLAPDEQREVLSVVKSVSYTENGPKFELYSPLDALSQLRALNGLDEPNKVAMKHDVTMHEMARLSDDELARIAAGGRQGDPAAPVNP